MQRIRTQPKPFNGAALSGKSVIIVGPSAHVKEDCAALDVDAFDVVCRLNQHWKTQLADRDVLGHRTDLLFHSMESWQYTPDDIQAWLEMGAEFISRIDPIVYHHHAKMRLFRARNKSSLRMRYIPQTVFDKHKAALQANPSTGTLAILHLLDFSIKSLTFVGFDFYDSLYLHRQDEAHRLSILANQIGNHDPKNQFIQFKRIVAREPRLIVCGRLKERLKA